jgi:hypothetical protein
MTRLAPRIDPTPAIRPIGLNIGSDHVANGAHRARPLYGDLLETRWERVTGDQ